MSTSKVNTPHTRESVYSTWMNLKNLSKGREIKGTIYNLGVVFGIAALVAFAFVLLPFLKPLLWAVLIGAVVYPVKREMSATMHSWFTDLERADGNIFANVLGIPLNSMVTLGQHLISTIRNNKNVLIGGAVVLASCKFLYEYAPKRFFCWTWHSFLFIHTNVTHLLSSQLSTTVLLTCLLVYFTTVCLLWRTANQFQFMVAGQSMWLLLLAYVCSFLGPLQVPVFLVVLGYGVAGFVFSYRTSMAERVAAVDEAVADEIRHRSITEKVKEFLCDQAKSANGNSLNASRVNKADLDLPLNGNRGGDDEAGAVTSAMFFKVLFMSCIITVLFKNPWLLFISVVPISLYFVKQTLHTTGAWAVLVDHVVRIQTLVWNWISERYNALLPVCLPGVIMLNKKIHDACK